MEHELEHLPPLAPDQVNVVVAMLGVEGNLVDAANFAELPVGRFLDLLQAPEVQTHLEAAELAAHQRACTRLAVAANAAVDTLECMAKDEQLDKTERRRAATAILRTYAPRLAPARRVKRNEPDRINLERLARMVQAIDADTSSESKSATADVPEQSDSVDSRSQPISRSPSQLPTQPPLKRRARRDAYAATGRAPP